MFWPDGRETISSTPDTMRAAVLIKSPAKLVGLNLLDHSIAEVRDLRTGNVTG